MRYFPTILTIAILSSCNVDNSQEERFKTVVTNLRQVGLFEDFKTLDDDQLTKTLIDKARKKYQIDGYDEFNEIFNPKTNADFFDLHVAELDETRVWWGDLEADVLNGNNVYARTVEKFGKLSGGYLKPDKVNEEWTTDEGPVKVSFWDSDTLRVFNLKFHDDWYD